MERTLHNYCAHHGESVELAQVWMGAGRGERCGYRKRPSLLDRRSPEPVACEIAARGIACSRGRAVRLDGAATPRPGDGIAHSYAADVVPGYAVLEDVAVKNRDDSCRCRRRKARAQAHPCQQPNGDPPHRAQSAHVPDLSPGTAQ